MTDPGGAASPTDAGTCWFCRREVRWATLIAGYDTWDEQRLACPSCDRSVRWLREHGWNLSRAANEDDAQATFDRTKEMLAAQEAPAPEGMDVDRLVDIVDMAAGEVMTGNDFGRYHKAIREHFRARLVRADEYRPFMVEGVREAHAGSRSAPSAAQEAPEGLVDLEARIRGLLISDKFGGESGVRVTVHNRAIEQALAQFIPLIDAMHGAEARPPEGLDAAVLAAALGEVEEWAPRDDPRLARKARMIAAEYARLSAGGATKP